MIKEVFMNTKLIAIKMLSLKRARLLEKKKRVAKLARQKMAMSSLVKAKWSST